MRNTYYFRNELSNSGGRYAASISKIFRWFFKCLKYPGALCSQRPGFWTNTTLQFQSSWTCFFAGSASRKLLSMCLCKNGRPCPPKWLPKTDEAQLKFPRLIVFSLRECHFAEAELRSATSNQLFKRGKSLWISDVLSKIIYVSWCLIWPHSRIYPIAPRHFAFLSPGLFFY